ncbi:aminoglycoside 2'-N-acetyltransferase [Amycolatopsis camponoti]|uniref:Aminoglycoside 2'-N-acetyltransferase n=1 Tax=Amycolatopsis camponoti TaxID=2606593 RepID=A0A6I8M6D6_9PSEU|nr:GNAT family N-acetyltransferase [Amycolatopsis camponoti]VVJ23257.1 aminoglycoside 2'-N-acetyltransferase [Amycolatopsis camponoti]
MIRLAHTAQLPSAELDAVRALLEGAFADFDLPGWENTLGGMHALTFDGDDLVGHASLVQRRLLHGDRVLNTGYVEGVAVHPDHRRRGVASALMAAMEDLLPGYEVGALSATRAGAPLYAGRGWQQWRGPTFALTPAGVRRTEDDDGGVYVFPGRASLDLDGALTADWRAGDVW